MNDEYEDAERRGAVEERRTEENALLAQCPTWAKHGGLWESKTWGLTAPNRRRLRRTAEKNRRPRKEKTQPKTDDDERK